MYPTLLYDVTLFSLFFLNSSLSFLEAYLKLNICSLDQLDELLRRNFGSQEVIVDGDSSTVLHTFLVTLRDAALVFAGVLSEQVEI